MHGSLYGGTDLCKLRLSSGESDPYMYKRVVATSYCFFILLRVISNVCYNNRNTCFLVGS